MDPIDRELASLLSVEPSAEFRARVRARIEGEPAPRSWYLPWRVAGAGVATLAVVMAIVVARINPANSGRKATEPAFDRSALPATALSVPLPSVSMRRSAASIHRVTPPVSAEVMVSASEARGLRQLAAIVREGRMQFVFPDERVSAAAQERGRDIVIAPIVVAAIEVTKKAEPVGNSEGDEQ